LKKVILPFIIKTKDEKTDLTYPAELACVACRAELQRKKTGFLRDTPEKTASLSRIYYPLWVIPTESKCLILDGLGFLSHKFTYKEPTQTGLFIEHLKETSTDPQEFMNALENQTKKIREFTAPTEISFRALLSDRELLNFFLEYSKNNSVINKNAGEEASVIPPEIDEETAFETSRTFTGCLRTMQAHIKGLQYALGILNEEVEFHKRAASYEIERLKEKCESETVKLRPEVEKNVKKLTMKHEKTLASVKKSTERKVAAMEKKRESYMRKLQGLENRKDIVQKRVNMVNKKSSGKSAYGSFELKKRDREIASVKKEIKVVSDALDEAKKDGDNRAKQVEEEFRSAAAQEEGKITEINATCEAKTKEKEKQISKMTSEDASVTSNFGSFTDELKRNITILRQQGENDWKLDTPEDAVLVLVPFYLIKYTKGNEERYSLLSPMSIAEEVSIMGSLRKMLTLNSEPKLKTLTTLSSKKLDDMLNSNVIEKMKRDEVFKNKISSVCRASNLLDRMEFAETLNEGLDEVVKRDWMTADEAAACCRRTLGEEA
jgi:hypothetical protein